MVISKEQHNSIEITVEKLRNKEVVIIPTDTVYGFSGIAPWTEDSIRQIKGREENKPFIQLISKPEDVCLIAKDNIPDKLLKYWPGPLTVIVESVKGGTVAVRCPGDAWLRKVIEETGIIYSTSVNRSGSSVLEECSQIIEEFNNEVELIVCDGDKINSLPSTIVSYVNSEIKIIRQGSLNINI